MMDAAEHLFHRHGFGGVSVEDVTSAVGVKKPDLYNHFRDKNDLYIAVRLRRLNRLEGDLARVLNVDAGALDRLTAVVAVLLRHSFFLSALAQREAEDFLSAEARDHLFARAYGGVYRPLTRFLQEAGVPEARLSLAYEALIGLTTHFAAAAPPESSPGGLARAAEDVAALWWHGAAGLRGDGAE